MIGGRVLYPLYGVAEWERARPFGMYASGH
jgi:hypothetical protein